METVSARITCAARAVVGEYLRIRGGGTPSRSSAISNTRGGVLKDEANPERDWECGISSVILKSRRKDMSCGERGSPCTQSRSSSISYCTFRAIPAGWSAGMKSLKRVWQGRLVSEATIDGCIKSARRVLGDSGDSQSYIRTVRGRGFELAVPVTAVDEGQSTVNSLRDQTQEAPGGRSCQERAFATRPFTRSRRFPVWNGATGVGGFPFCKSERGV